MINRIRENINIQLICIIVLAWLLTTVTILKQKNEEQLKKWLEDKKIQVEWCIQNLNNLYHNDERFLRIKDDAVSLKKDYYFLDK